MLPADITEDDPRFVGYDEETIVVDRVDDPKPMIPAPVLPNRGEGFFDGPGPNPRRSALSSVTPPEADSAAVAKPSATVEGRKSRGLPEWAVAHAKSFVASAIAVAILAAGAGIFGFFSSRSATPSAEPSLGETSTEGLPRVTEADLIAEADAKALSPNATWAVAKTTTSFAEHSARPACLSTESSDTARLDSLQRTLGTTEADQLALLHQLDSYPSEQVAKEAYQKRAKALAACSEVQTLILSASSVSGLGDEATAIAVLDEGEAKRFHSLLLYRAGNVLSIVDVASASAAPSVSDAAAALKRTAQQVCASVGCEAGEVTVADAPVPAVDPAGWLIPSDLPRIRPGFGRWTTKPPVALTSRGTGCENMTLASDAGPTERLQATYLLTQDDLRPENFGLDEMVFTFENAEQATEFSEKLVGAINGCGSRVLGTTATAVEGPEGANSFEIVREVDGGSVLYQVSVVAEGSKVAYLLTTISSSYKFTPEQLGSVALRAKARLGQ